MDLNGTGSQSWPLTTGNNDNPSLVQGKPTSFFCNTVPDRCPTGPLAYALPYVLLTIAGTLTQPATSGSPVYYDVLRACLIDSIDWITAWHGTPVSANHVKGAFLPLVEYLSGGYRFATRQRPPIPAAAGAYPFELTVAIPASSSKLGDNLSNTSQLALLYQTSQIKVNVAAAGVLDSVSTGATFTGGITARASAKLIPTTELVLGTAVETILHQTVAGANSPQVQIKGFGTDTLLNGVQAKGGVMWLGELTNVNLQGGVFAAENVTQYAFPWRGQQQTQHPQAILADFLGTMVNDRPHVMPTTVAGGDSEFTNYPYVMKTSDQPTTTSTLMDLKGLQAWIMVQGGDRFELTDCQTADSDQSYFLTVNGGFSAGSHLILARYARAWQAGMLNNWVGQITKGGSNSLAAYVLGQNYARGQLRQRLPARHTLTPDQRTYLPWQFAL